MYLGEKCQIFYRSTFFNPKFYPKHATCAKTKFTKKEANYLTSKPTMQWLLCIAARFHLLYHMVLKIKRWVTLFTPLFQINVQISYQDSAVTTKQHMFKAINLPPLIFYTSSARHAHDIFHIWKKLDWRALLVAKELKSF